MNGEPSSHQGGKGGFDWSDKGRVAASSSLLQMGLAVPCAWVRRSLCNSPRPLKPFFFCCYPADYPMVKVALIAVLALFVLTSKE